MTNDTRTVSKKERNSMKENELKITAYRNAACGFAHCLIGKEFDCISIVPGFMDQADVTREGGWVNLQLLFVELSFLAAGRIHTGAAIPSWEDGWKEALEYWFEAYSYLNQECPVPLSLRIIKTTEQ